MGRYIIAGARLPGHPDPNVRKMDWEVLSGSPKVYLIEQFQCRASDQLMRWREGG